MYSAWGVPYEIALRWMPLDLTDDKSTLVQVMAWCCQATSHYLSQCWPRSMSPNGVTRPQWVNTLRPRQNGHHFADNMPYRYRKYHCGDKTVLRSSYLHSGISYTSKTTSLYWIRAQAAFLIFFSIAIFSPYFFLVGSLLQYVALFQLRN